eukprot:TRINITY_DN6558_c0_g1_i4.p1 TRINITY_DN6558_c0_g1~~TRINITY_DN6558_c0_g1_i4.p1  ORF type:complete len:627 (+),score=173.76 TRINITY_DN6558_c0_g1_i4:53-1933(+)
MSKKKAKGEKSVETLATKALPSEEDEPLKVVSISDYLQKLRNASEEAALQESENLASSLVDQVEQLVLSGALNVSNSPFTMDEFVLELIKDGDGYPAKSLQSLYFEGLESKFVGTSLEESKNMIGLMTSSIIIGIEQGTITIAQTTKNLDDELSKVGKSVQEEELRKLLLREKAEQKKHLEERLAHLDLEVSMLRSESHEPRGRSLGRGVMELNDEVTVKSNRDFVRRMMEERRQIEERRLERLRREEEKRRVKDEELREKEMEEKRLLQEERAGRIQRNLEGIEERSRARDEEAKRWKDELTKLKEQKPRYLARQEEFEAEKRKQEEEIQARLAEELKAKLKPVDLEELKEHERKFKEAVEKRRREKEAELKSALSSMEVKRPDFESRFHKQIEEETRKIAEAEKERHERVKEMIDKRLKYAETIKEQYVPKIDLSKRVELIKSIEDLNPHKKGRSPIRNRSLTAEDRRGAIEEAPEGEEEVQKGKDAKEIGNNYLAQLREKVKRAKASEAERPSEVAAHDKSIRSENTDKRKATDPPPNYLKEVREKNLLRKEAAWESIARKKELSVQAKTELIKAQAEKMEEVARQREKVLRLQKGVNNEALGELDDLYIASIKAKLSLLNKD